MRRGIDFEISLRKKGEGGRSISKKFQDSFRLKIFTKIYQCSGAIGLIPERERWVAQAFAAYLSHFSISSVKPIVSWAWGTLTKTF